MKKNRRILVCSCLAAALLLNGCRFADLGEYLMRLQGELDGSDVIAYNEMEYQRPNMTALEQTLQDSCNTARTSEDLDTVINGIYAYYDVYDSFYTNMSLAYIRYSGDLRDLYWQEEYDYCAANYPIADAGLEELYRALAQSPCRAELETDVYFGPGYFDAYEEESVWDEKFLAMLEEETAMENQYYDLMSQGEEAYSDIFLNTYEEQLGQLLVDLVSHRQEIAVYMGYDSYSAFAYDFYHYRDYTPTQAEEYLEMIRQELVPLYRQVNQSQVWNIGAAPCTEQEMLDYTRRCAQAMGGYISDAFDLMEVARLYDIAYGEYKMDSSFEVYLDSYYEPFVFVCPTGSAYDKLVLVHEFGHFAHDYVCYGSYAGTDVAEVLSQGMEYLSLFYADDGESLEELKLSDGLCIYVEQAAYAAFEHQLYSLTGDNLTVENVAKLYERIGLDYGFDSWDWDSRDYVLMTHFYTEPMYLISYVVSNDAAFQLYQLELAQSGAGLEVYEQMLHSEETWFGTFVETYGLENPFALEHIQSVRATMEKILK